MKHNKYITIFSTALIIILIDQIAKFLIKTNFQLDQSLPLIKDIFHLTYRHNYGAGFGILQQQNWILIFISIIVIGIIFYYFDRIKEKEILLHWAGMLSNGPTRGEQYKSSRRTFVRCAITLLI